MSVFQVLKELIFGKPLHMQFEEALVQEEAAKQPETKVEAPVVEKPERVRKTATKKST